MGKKSLAQKIQDVPDESKLLIQTTKAILYTEDTETVTAKGIGMKVKCQFVLVMET